MFYVGMPRITIGELARAAVSNIASQVGTTIALGTSQAAIKGVEVLNKGEERALELVEPLTWEVGRALERTFVVPKMLAKTTPVDVVDDCETFLAAGLMGLQLGLAVATQAAFGDARKTLAKQSVTLLRPLADAVDCSNSERATLDNNLAFLQAVHDKGYSIIIGYTVKDGALSFFHGEEQDRAH